jgi:hypothetical protein
MTITRVPYPPPLRPPGPQAMSSSEQQVQFSTGDRVLAHWIGNGSTHVTAFGSTPATQPDAGLYTVVARLTVRRGKVTRSEEWGWPCSGFVRRLVADEVLITAHCIVQQANQPFTLGAAVIEGVLADDGYTSLLPGSVIAGLPPNFLLAPNGCREFRGWSLNGAGFDVQFFNRTADPAAPTAVGPIYPITQFADWTPWPTVTSGLFGYGALATDLYAHVEFRI